MLCKPNYCRSCYNYAVIKCKCYKYLFCEKCFEGHVQEHLKYKSKAQYITINFKETKNYRFTKQIRPKVQENEGKYEINYFALMEGHTNWVTSLALSSDNTLLISGSSDCTIFVWNLLSKIKVATLEKHKMPVTCLLLAKKNSLLASGSIDTTIKLWSLETYQELTVLKGHTRTVTSLAMTPNEKNLISASLDASCKIWDIDKKILINSLDFCFSEIITIKISSNGLFLASGSEDSKIIIWDLFKNSVITVLNGHSLQVKSLLIIKDSNFLVSGSEDKTIRIWDLNKKTQEHVFTGHTDGVTCLCLANYDKFIVSASKDITVRIWNLELKCLERVLKGHVWNVNCVVALDNKFFVFSGSHDRSIIMWDLTNGFQTLNIEKNGKARSIFVCANRKYALVRESDETKLFDLKTNIKIASIDDLKLELCYALIDRTTESAFIGTYISSFVFWGLSTRKVKVYAEKLTYKISTLAITNNRKYVVSGSKELIYRVWQNLSEIFYL